MLHSVDVVVHSRYIKKSYNNVIGNCVRYSQFSDELFNFTYCIYVSILTNNASDQNCVRSKVIQ